MVAEQLEAGWYPDPAGRSDLRWWDGTRWTTATREQDDHPTGPIAPVLPPSGENLEPDTPAGWSRHQPPVGSDAQTRAPQYWAPPSLGTATMAGSAPGPSQPRRRPWVGRVALLAAGLALVGVGAIVAVLLQSGEDGADQLVADGGSDAGATTGGDAPATSPDAPPVDAPADDPSAAPDPLEPQEDDLGTGADGVERSDEPDELQEEDDAAVDDPITIDFDGKCEVSVPLSQAQEEELRAWDFPACTGAPVTLVGDQERWIVVVSSLNGEDFTESEALERAAREGGDGVLWSSHYPSLNPDLWVVFDGPFNDESTARDAANRRGQGAYQRVLSDDEGDRYCLAADGCTGERDR